MTEAPDYRDPKLAKRIADKIAALTPKTGEVKICHVCGTHEWTITHYGIRSLLPDNLEVIAGPGCPVCILPASEMDAAIELARKGVAVTCFGDVLRVPGSHGSLLDAKADGADVRIVYSTSDAIKMAEKEPAKEFMFFAVGFETTAPSTAIEVASQPPRNLSFLIAHRIVPPAMELLAKMEDLSLDGFIAPGHVSTVIGLKPYEVFPSKYALPTVVAGFEPLDLLFAVYMIVKQLSLNSPRLENEYTRAVQPEGNPKAKKCIEDVFTVDDGKWRGLGVIPGSTLFLKDQYVAYDALRKHGITLKDGIDSQPGCRCHLVVVGKIKPDACPLFLRACTPQNPVGACMVSMEGTCRVWAKTVGAQRR
ncbi:MAG: hydrogenase formation protein HypD [Candidatus Bathyarchaeia archaeon]